MFLIVIIAMSITFHFSLGFLYLAPVDSLLRIVQRNLKRKGQVHYYEEEGQDQQERNKETHENGGGHEILNVHVLNSLRSHRHGRAEFRLCSTFHHIHHSK